MGKRQLSARQKNRLADLLVLFCGALLPLAYAPFGLWPLLLIAFAVLFLFTSTTSSGRALWRGYLFGLGWFGVGVSWVYVSVRLFGNANAPLAGLITALLVLVLACYPLLAVWLTRALTTAKSRFMPVLVIPAAWVLVEWLRGWLFTGFPWLEPGYAFIDTPLSAFAPLAGVLSVTYLAILSATLLALLFRAGAATLDRVLAVIILAVVWLGVSLIEIGNFTTPQGKPLTVALVQGNIPQHRKWLAAERVPTLAMYRKQTERHWDKDIVIWPETAVPAFEDQVMDYLNAMHTAAQVTSTQLLTGIVVRESHGDRYFNAMVSLGNTDRGADTIYKKQHLVPFGEYLPLAFLLDPLLDFLEIPMSDFSAAEQAGSQIKLGHYQAGASICFESVFSHAIRDALPDAAYLINISNDAWFGDSLAPHQHLQITRMRALETGRYLLRSTNTGISAIIEPDGQIQARTAQFKQEVLTGIIQPLQGSTPFVRWGYYPILLFSLLLLVLAGSKLAAKNT